MRIIIDVFMIVASCFFLTGDVHNEKRLLPKWPAPEHKTIIILGLKAIFDKNLNAVPDGHEREAHKETKSASYVRNQWDEGVD